MTRLDMSIRDSSINSYISLTDAMSSLDEAAIEQKDLQTTTVIRGSQGTANVDNQREVSAALLAFTAYAKKFNKHNHDTNRRSTHGKGRGGYKCHGNRRHAGSRNNADSSDNHSSDSEDADRRKRDNKRGRKDDDRDEDSKKQATPNSRKGFLK